MRTVSAVGIVVFLGFSLACGDATSIGGGGGSTPRTPDAAPKVPAYQPVQAEADAREAVATACALYDKSGSFKGADTKGKWRLDKNGLWVEAWKKSQHIQHEQAVTGVYLVGGEPRIAGPDGMIGCATTPEAEDPLVAGTEPRPWVMVRDAGAGADKATAVAGAVQGLGDPDLVVLGETLEAPEPGVVVKHTKATAELAAKISTALGTTHGAVTLEEWPDRKRPAPVVVNVGGAATP
ncbi:MAG: hypothetical protein R3F61_36895 [Myxococcota bacterium]